MLADAFTAIGHALDQARWLATHTRARFVDHTVGWGVFDDTVPTCSTSSRPTVGSTSYSQTTCPSCPR